MAIDVDAEPCDHHAVEAAPQVSRLLEALDELDAAASKNIERSREMQRRVRRFRRAINAGTPLALLVEAEKDPRTVEMISINIEILQGVGAQLRIAQAQQLRNEGLTIVQIAQLFGVSRQRVSALLKQKSARTPIGDPLMYDEARLGNMPDVRS